MIQGDIDKYYLLKTDVSSYFFYDFHLIYQYAAFSMAIPHSVSCSQGCLFTIFRHFNCKLQGGAHLQLLLFIPRNSKKHV